jgi:hypothetical protein
MVTKERGSVELNGFLFVRIPAFSYNHVLSECGNNLIWTTMLNDGHMYHESIRLQKKCLGFYGNAKNAPKCITRFFGGYDKYLEKITTAGVDVSERHNKGVWRIMEIDNGQEMSNLLLNRELDQGEIVLYGFDDYEVLEYLEVKDGVLIYYAERDNDRVSGTADKFKKLTI